MADELSPAANRAVTLALRAGRYRTLLAEIVDHRHTTCDHATEPDCPIVRAATYLEQIHRGNQ